MNLVSLLVATSIVKYSSNTGLRVGVALVAVIIIVAAIVFSKRRASGMGEAVPADAEVTGAVSPAVDGAAPEAEGDGESSSAAVTSGSAPESVTAQNPDT
jgi:K(+)-stimulated pyrophosphate-energized sodium pump